MPSRKPSQEKVEQIKDQFQAAESKILEISKEPDKERHFKLLYNVALEAVDADLSKIAYRLWIYLSANYPFSDCEVELPSQTELGIRLGVSRQAVNIAAAELQSAGLWDFWAERWKGRNLRGFSAPGKGVSKNRQVSGKPDTLSTKSDTRCQVYLTPCQQNLTPCQQNLTPATPEPLPQADSKTPQTIQTYSDLDQTTTDKDDVAAAEKKGSKPNSEEQVLEENSQNEQPTEEEVTAALQNVADVIPEIKISSTVKKFLIKFWVNFPLALAATEEVIKSGALKNPTGFFMEALKNPVVLPETITAPAKKPKKDWKYEDDWTQHPQYAKWLPAAYKGRWEWMKEPPKRADRIERGTFIQWCEANNAFSIFEDNQT